MGYTKIQLNEAFAEEFDYNPSVFFVSPGRLEIIGNHTDHNKGKAIVAGASLNMTAAASPTKNNEIRLYSNGYGLNTVKLKKVDPESCKKSTTISLIQGIVSTFIEKGYKVGGFDAYVTSDVIVGSGISSSAAFEMIVCEILNYLFNGDKIEKIELVKIGQIAESKYFGKPCGLLDQIGSCFGGISYVDFNNETPEVRNTIFPFNLHVILTNPGGSHAGLDSYYASIPSDMRNAAKAMGAEVLREISYESFKEFVDKGIEFTPMQIQRAVHFYNECIRVDDTYQAIIDNDVDMFVKNINASGLSSSNILCNTFVPGRFEQSPEEALKLARMIAPKSAHRVHGGGFMGTIISFVLPEEVETFKKEMSKKYGEHAVIDVSIADKGVSVF